MTKNALRTPNEIFNAAYHGQPNFMTPHIDKRGALRLNGERYAYEISHGEWWNPGEMLYGVTVLKDTPVPGEAYRHDFNKLFGSYQDALAYVQGLKERKDD